MRLLFSLNRLRSRRESGRQLGGPWWSPDFGLCLIIMISYEPIGPHDLAAEAGRGSVHPSDR